MGKILYEENFTEGFVGIRKWINFDVGAEIGQEGEELRMEIRGNRLDLRNSSMMVIQPAFSKSLYRFREIVFEKNQVNSTDNILEISSMYSGCSTLGEPETSLPSIRFHQNQGHQNLLKFVGYKNLPDSQIWEEGEGRPSIPAGGKGFVPNPGEETPMQKKNVLNTPVIIIILGIILLALFVSYLVTLPNKRRRLTTR
jgi:hypothetical protein